MLYLLLDTILILNSRYICTKHKEIVRASVFPSNRSCSKTIQKEVTIICSKLKSYWLPPVIISQPPPR